MRLWIWTGSGQEPPLWWATTLLVPSLPFSIDDLQCPQHTAPSVAPSMRVTVQRRHHPQRSLVKEMDSSLGILMARWMRGEGKAR